MSVDSSVDPGDPVGYFLEDVTYHGRTERTRSAYERVLREFEDFLAEERRVDDPASASHRDCMAFVHGLRGAREPSTVATYASYLHRFYEYMVKVGAFTSNPMTIVMEELDESIAADPARRDVSMGDMRAFVDDVTHPLERAVIITLLKTGIRAGELCNLDRRDLNLDGARATRPAIDGRPNSLFVSSDPARGESYNGESRSASNKRKRDTTIPVDDELARSLGRWLAIRPDPRSPADPLFCSTSEWGKRLTTAMVHHVVASNARENGWYESGGDASENVTPHYFRHFFTTHLRERTGETGVVKYLRGDVASDVIDTYTHEWGDRVRNVYLDNIYRLM